MLSETLQLALPAPSPAGSLQVVNFGEETKLAACRSPALPKDREVRAQHQEPDLERANLEAAWVTSQLEFSTLLIANGTPKKQRGQQTKSNYCKGTTSAARAAPRGACATRKAAGCCGTARGRGTRAGCPASGKVQGHTWGTYYCLS